MEGEVGMGEEEVLAEMKEIVDYQIWNGEAALASDGGLAG